jgi:hypothetical protein
MTRDGPNINFDGGRLPGAMTTKSPGRPPKRCYVNGKRWPSQAAASRALKVSPAAISKALKGGRFSVRIEGKGEFV